MKSSYFKFGRGWFEVFYQTPSIIHSIFTRGTGEPVSLSTCSIGLLNKAVQAISEVDQSKGGK